MRVYTTLVAGAAGVDRRRFFTGIGPATVLWVIAFTLLGVVAGVPAEHFSPRASSWPSRVGY
jgi:membrane protein DedA with SNARE-associated domain